MNIRSLRGILALAVFMALAAGLLATLEAMTRERADANLAFKKNRATVELTGSDGPFPESDFALCDAGIAVVRTSARGYGGAIELLVAWSFDGTLHGARVSNHHETPGYADILQSDDWLGALAKRPLDQLDAVSGATVTSAAVLAGITSSNAVVEALISGCPP